MKEFKVRSGNFLKSSNSTSNMMYTILVVLIPFIIFSTYKNGIYPIIKGYGNLYLVFKPLIFASVASLFCIVTEYLYYYIKKDKRSFYKLFSESYAIISSVFLSLIIPINTPIWLVIIGSIIASLSKVLMGGLGKNKLNPALVGSLFITIIFSSLTGGYLNPYEVDVVSSATPLTNMTASGYLVTYDNLVNAIRDAIDKQMEEDGAEYFTDNKNNLFEDTTKELDFDDLMEQFNSIVNKLISENDETKFKEYWQPRVVQITDKYLGRGQKVSQCSREQVEALSLIVDDLKELINK